MTFVNKFLAMFPCKNGDKLEIYLDSEYPRIVSYFLASKSRGDCQHISEYEAQGIMHDEGFLFTEIPETRGCPTHAKGELIIP